jgi:hypothetical protein
MRIIDPRIIGTLVVLVAAAACHHDEKDDAGINIGDASFPVRDTTRVLKAGDLRIATRDSSIELALVGDSIMTGLGKKVLDKIRHETDTTAAAGSGLGASIEKMVKNTVATTLSRELHYPIAAISDVRYEDGEMRFFAENGSRMRLFESSKVNGQPLSEAFNPDDARRFVDAFHARKGPKTVERP